MQTLIDQHGPFTLPTHWGEVSTAQFCATDPLQTVAARATARSWKRPNPNAFN